MYGALAKARGADMKPCIPYRPADPESAAAPLRRDTLRALDSGEMDEATERQLVAALIHSGRYRVLQRLEPRPYYHPPDGTDTRRALYVDVETTGLGDADPIIQLAAVPFAYGPACGRIFEVGACEVWYEDPGIAIPTVVTRLTGITDADVAGRHIDGDRVAELAGGAALVVAHNAQFDRPRLERRLPLFSAKPWGCSCHDVPWLTEGLESTKLSWLAYRVCGAFYEAHRADADCLMAVHLLTAALPSGTLAMAALLSAARARTARVWAVESPFATKDVLRCRGYRWHGGEGGLPRAWWRDVPEASAADEGAWLARTVYDGPPRARVQIYDARVRHSTRVASRPFMPWAQFLAWHAARTPVRARKS